MSKNRPRKRRTAQPSGNAPISAPTSRRVPCRPPLQLVRTARLDVSDGSAHKADSRGGHAADTRRRETHREWSGGLPEESSRKKHFVERIGMEIVGQRAVETDCRNIFVFGFCRTMLTNVLTQFLDQCNAGVPRRGTKLGRRDGHRSRTDVEAPRGHPVQGCLEWNGPDTAEWIKQSVAGLGERPYQVMSERGLHLSLIGAQRVQRVSPVALGKATLPVGEITLETEPFRLPGHAWSNHPRLPRR